MPFEIVEVFRYFDLGLIHQLLEMTDAQRARREQADDAQSRSVTETGVDANKLHAILHTYTGIYAKGNFVTLPRRLEDVMVRNRRIVRMKFALFLRPNAAFLVCKGV
jgi:hypothetical protein